MKKRAFTLIELLVVIAIIAVLMAILMPSLKRAREQARSLTCRSNVRTLTLAWLMYKDENDGKLVSGQTPGAPISTSNPAAWVVIPPSGASSSIEEKKEYIQQGLLWPYVRALEVYRCPSDRRRNSPGHQFAFRTYSIAGGMNAVPANTWEIHPCVNYTDIKQPATKYVFLAECDPRGYNNGSWVMNPRSRQWVDPFGVWHRDDSSTLGYADGHVEMQRWHSRADFEVMLKGYAYRSLL